MNGWQLMPGEIGKILTTTGEAAQRISAQMQPLAESTVEPIQQGAGFDGVVAEAFNGFLQEQFEGDLKGMLNGFGAALQATAAATNAYIAGDEEMAASMVAATTEAAATGDFTRFQGGV